MISRPGLLVSVRSVAEARSALEGGADIIDIKEPNHGALGRADDNVIADILRYVAGRKPVSAAMGELNSVVSTQYSVLSTPAVSFAKWGLAGLANRDWASALDHLRDAHANLRIVTVAYADWQLAEAPPLSDVVHYALDHSPGVLLIDTCSKTRPLLDWLPEREIQHICDACRAAGVRIALAGSLDAWAIERLRCANPDWFAVRGAACDDGRQGRISAAKVRSLSCLANRRTEARTAS